MKQPKTTNPLTTCPKIVVENCDFSGNISLGIIVSGENAGKIDYINIIPANTDIERVNKSLYSSGMGLDNPQYSGKTFNARNLNEIVIVTGEKTIEESRNENADTDNEQVISKKAGKK